MEDLVRFEEIRAEQAAVDAPRVESHSVWPVLSVGAFEHEAAERIVSENHRSGCGLEEIVPARSVKILARRPGSDGEELIARGSLQTVNWVDAGVDK